MELMPISCEDARDKHGIVCQHSFARETGELRFRLLKNDGTAYIRTEAAPLGGWQDSHYHLKVLETYIVQSGWMGFAVEVAGKPQLTIYHAGESFTTAPHIIHNVYLPKGAVIHTVKHGDSTGEKRREDGRTLAFTAVLRNISEEELLAKDRRPPEPVAAQQSLTTSTDYGEAYRHFDNLIWQVPAWTSAIFTLVLIGTTAFDSSAAKLIALPAATLISSFYGLSGVFLLALSYALHRFRWHQINIKNYTPSGEHLSPQVGLQLLVNVQGIVMLFLAALIQRTNTVTAFLLAIAALSLITYLSERALYREGVKGGRPIDTRS